MEVSGWAGKWAWVAVGLSGLGVLYALGVTFAMAAMQPRRPPRPSWRDLGFLTGLAVLFGTALFLATLLQGSPFSPGQGLGRGFLIGAAATLLAAWFLEAATVPGTASEPSSSLRSLLRLQPSATVGGLMGGATLAVWLGARGMAGNLLTALPGIAAGAWFVVFVVASPRTLEPASGPSQRVAVRLLWLLAALLSVLACGVVLATQNAAAFGAEPATVRSYFLLLAAGSLLALVLSGPLLPQTPARSGRPLRRATASLILLLAVAGILALGGAFRILESSIPSFPWLIGLLTGALALGLTTVPVPGTGKEGADSSLDFRQSFVVGLLLLGMVGAAFALQRGLGMALATLGFLLPVAWREMWEFTWVDPALPASPGPLSAIPHLAVSFLVLMLLFRLFYERYPLGRGRADLYLQSPFIGLLGGMLVAFGVGTLRMAMRARPQSLEEGAEASADLPIPVEDWLDWLLRGGLGMILAPSLIAFLWGAAGSAGFLAGLAVFAFLMGLFTPALRDLPRTALSETVLFGLPLLGLMALQGTHLLASASQATRQVKAIVLLVALGMALLWSLGRRRTAHQVQSGTRG